MDPRFFLMNLVLYFAGLLLSIFGTAWFARKLSTVASMWLCAASAIVGALAVMRFMAVGIERGSMVEMLFSFFPLFMALGFLIGSTFKSRDVEENNALTQKQQQLAAWQRLLALHQQQNQHPLVQAADYRQIGDLERELGQIDLSINAYHQADAIYRKYMNAHPSLAEFYTIYAQVLNTMTARADMDERQRANGRQRVRELQELARIAGTSIAELA